MATLFVDKLDPQSGTALEIGSSGDTITIPSGATLTNNGTATGFPANTPYFTARLGSDQDIGYTGTFTKIEIDTEYFDSASAFDTSNYRFTPQTAGKYFVFGQCAFETTSGSNSGNNLVALVTSIYKNGSNIVYQKIDRGGQLYSFSKRIIGVSMIVDMNGSSDYLELYGMANSNNAGSTRVTEAISDGGSIFGAYFLAT